MANRITRWLDQHWWHYAPASKLTGQTQGLWDEGDSHGSAVRRHFTRRQRARGAAIRITWRIRNMMRL
jgi:hypothetical protein